MGDFARRANYKKIDLENYKKECRHVGSARLCRLLPTGRKKSDKSKQNIESMIEVKNAKGGTVNIYGGWLNDGKPAGKRWIKRWHVFGLTFAVSNRRVKMREPSKDRWTWQENPDGKRGPLNTMKHQLYEETDGCCQQCGEKHKFRHLQLHHILPFARMSQFGTDPRNVMLLCHRCHQEIHSNPLRQVEMMKQKADELGVDLKDYYDYGEGQDTQHQ